MGLHRSILQLASKLVLCAGCLAALAVLYLKALPARVAVGVVAMLLGGWGLSGLLGVGLASLGSRVFTFRKAPTLTGYMLPDCKVRRLIWSHLAWWRGLKGRPC
jgi:hypothetical protein